jgi:hypothetical protein
MKRFCSDPFLMERAAWQYDECPTFVTSREICFSPSSQQKITQILMGVARV